jgi:hypothetical protein
MHVSWRPDLFREWYDAGSHAEPAVTDAEVGQTLVDAQTIERRTQYVDLVKK